jgi:hypothetical protein
MPKLFFQLIKKKLQLEVTVIDGFYLPKAIAKEILKKEACVFSHVS